MFGICLEASHERGLGHLYRMRTLAKVMQRKHIPFVLLVNDDCNLNKVLSPSEFQIVYYPARDVDTNWQEAIVKKHQINCWIDDRLDTSEQHSRKVKSLCVPLVTFDNRGSGAAHADLNIVGLSFSKDEDLNGKKILRGYSYLIIDPDLKAFRRRRTKINRILVTMGGSDTYGVTVTVLRALKRLKQPATIITGPAFQHFEELHSELNKDYVHKNAVAKLGEEFYDHDLAITGGGVTPFEANSTGLPCLIIANEHFEIPIALGLEQLGCSKFLGYREHVQDIPIHLSNNIEQMSRHGIEKIGHEGVNRVLEAILSVQKYGSYSSA